MLNIPVTQVVSALEEFFPVFGTWLSNAAVGADAVRDIQRRGRASRGTLAKVLVGGTHQVKCLMRQPMQTAKANTFTPS